MNIFQALILGIVEGVTEFLPISSTGHMILASKLMMITQSDFIKSFEIIIQSGAILSVLVLYGKKLIESREILKKTIVAFIPTAIVGFGLYKIIKTVLIGNTNVTVFSLLVGGIALIMLERHFKGKEHTMDIHTLSYKNAFIIGLIQSISVIPGVSRAAATIIGGLSLGMDRTSAVEFSFILAIPTLLAATGLDLVKSGHNFNMNQLELLGVGFITSFVVALIVMKWFIKFVKTNTFIPFGIYRIIIALTFLLLVH